MGSGEGWKRKHPTAQARQRGMLVMSGRESRASDAEAPLACPNTRPTAPPVPVQDTYTVQRSAAAVSRVNSMKIPPNFELSTQFPLYIYLVPV